MLELYTVCAFIIGLVTCAVMAEGAVTPGAGVGLAAAGFALAAVLHLGLKRDLSEAIALSLVALSVVCFAIGVWLAVE